MQKRAGTSSACCCSRRLTCLQVYDVPDGSEPMSAAELTRRTSQLTVGAGAGGAAPAAAAAAAAEHPTITVGVYTHVGDPEVHANEDRATVRCAAAAAAAGDRLLGLRQLAGPRVLALPSLHPSQ